MLSEPSAKQDATQPNEDEHNQTMGSVLGSTEDRLAFLALAGERLGCSLDLATTLRNLGRLSVPMIADGCVVELLEADGRLHRAHAHFINTPFTDTQFSDTPFINTPSSDLRAPSKPALEETHNTAVPAAAHGTISLISAPLIAFNRPLGVLTLSVNESGRHYSPNDLAIAEDLARRAAVAIENARLHHAEHAAREAAERAVERTQRLHALTSSLAVAATPMQVADVALRQGMSAIDAKASALALYTRDSAITVVLAHGFAHGALNRGMRLAVDSARALAFSFRFGQPLWLESESAIQEVSPKLELEHLPSGPPRAVVAMPMMSTDKPTGALTFYFDKPKAFSVEDKNFLATLTRQTTQALDRSRLLEKAQREQAASQLATIRLAALQTMTEQLSAPMGREQVADIIVDHVREMFPNCKALVATISDDGKHLDCVRATGHTQETLDRYDTMDLEFPSPLTDAVRNMTPVFFDNPKTVEQHYPILAGSIADPAPSLVAAVPFTMEGRALGGLLLRIFETSRGVGQDQAFIMYIARVCTQSLERARLYEAERRARAEADAERRRLELLAEISAVINASLDRPTISEAIARVTVPRFASFCLVCAIDETGAPRFVNAVHQDPAEEALLREMRERYPFGPNHPVTEAARTRKPQLTPIWDDAHRRTIAADEHHLQLLNKSRTTSSLVVPLVARDHLLGVLSFGLVGGHFTSKDLALGEELAQRAAFALDNARLYNEAQEANRIKDEFLGVVSHELRTPLNAILGWTRMLRTGTIREGQQPRALEAIERNSREQARLVDELLDVSRIAAGKLQLDTSLIDLRPAVENAIQTVTPAANAKDIQIVLRENQEPIQILADENRIQQVVWNLLSNAIKFTQRGGHIKITVQQSIDSAAEIIVSDNGPGIQTDLLPHLFEAFRQGDSSLTRGTGGLGLGLSIVRRFVEAHGGTVQAENNHQTQGATLTVKLPLAKPERNPTTTTRKKQLEPGSLQGITILIVDDDIDARTILVEMLTNAGATVKNAAGVAEALGLLADHPPDILISDIAMPGEDGISLIRKIRARTPNRIATMPAIAVSAYTRTEDRIKALSAGYQLHLPKPLDPTELITTITNLQKLTQDKGSRP